MKYETVIGLEVHVHLNTNSKIFCSCSTEFGQAPNTQTCPICLGLPGVLPVLNMKAMEFAVKTALALKCNVAAFTKFDRKHYFYPDLPKNFQISQYDQPLAEKGIVEIDLAGIIKPIRIKRVHLEEDAGKLLHAERESYVDLNRTGIPLLEIVTEPDISSPEEAYLYLDELKAIIKYLEVSDCDMEKGSLRCDANISIREAGSKSLGTKVELKNMNSFKGVRDALQFEVQRQSEVLTKDKQVIQETRLWDEERQKTYSMRSKEEAHDYRYFPEPDLMPYTFDKDFIESIKKTVPELPRERKKRFINDFALGAYDAGILTADKDLADYFEECLGILNLPKTIANWLIGDVMGQINLRRSSISKLGLSVKNLTGMIRLIEKEAISQKTAKEILPLIIDTGKSAEGIIKEKGLKQISDEVELAKIIDETIMHNQKTVDDFLNGNEKAVMFLVGEVMKKTKGRANPKIVNALLKERLFLRRKNNNS
ncbi:MAG: Asp-tRNA(Asn)/Glu-tRNA(Gln) amidotransferase subunit GatB [Candidatus Omnitrophota bacterium]